MQNTANGELTSLRSMGPISLLNQVMTKKKYQSFVNKFCFLSMYQSNYFQYFHAELSYRDIFQKLIDASLCTQVELTWGCWSCAPGEYQPSVGQTSCLSCPAGSYTATWANTACWPCPSGKFCTGGAHNDPCSAGTYSGSGASNCQTCTSGWYTTTPGNSACWMCPTGKYCMGGSHNADCSAGMYSGSGIFKEGIFLIRCRQIKMQFSNLNFKHPHILHTSDELPRSKFFLQSVIPKTSEIEKLVRP